MKKDGITMLAKTLNKLAYKINGMLFPLKVRFVSRRVAFTIIF